VYNSLREDVDVPVGNYRYGSDGNDDGGQIYGDRAITNVA
jgi:hypothetical protein